MKTSLNELDQRITNPNGQNAKREFHKVSVFYSGSIQRVSLQNRVIMAICQLSQMSALDNLDDAQKVEAISEKKKNSKKASLILLPKQKNTQLDFIQREQRLLNFHSLI